MKSHTSIRIGEYNDQSDAESVEQAEVVIPEDLSALSADELEDLHSRAVTAFDGLYGDGSLSSEDLEALSALTEGIEALSAERTVRREAEAARAAQAAELASRVHLSTDDGEPDDEQVDEQVDEHVDQAEEVEEGAEEAVVEAVEQAEPIAASASPQRREVRVPMRARGRREPALPEGERPRTMRDIVHAAGEGTGYANGAGVDWTGVGRIVDNRLKGYNHGQYAAAARAGRHMREKLSVATIQRPLDDDLIIKNSDPEHVEAVLNRARSTSRLPGQSLVAAGGWCAPNTVIYDLLELESRDGLFSVPTVGWARGGISRTLGPDFADIFAADIGFHYTEEEDIAGDYDGDGGGSKPCYRIECPEFEDFRLEIDGLCIQAGLLMQRGYPEVIARTVRGVLVAHDHKMAARRINSIVLGSDAVTMPGGAAALTPVLSAIELQVEHMRYIRRLARSTVMEAVFPYWVRGLIRADLSRQSGVALFSVSDAQITAWFTERGVVPQFIYNWQDLTGVPSDITSWPTEVDFLLYPAGTWIEGVSDIITIDTLYDSVLLGTNDYTALFTEEGNKVVKMGFDSRVVTVPVCPDGSAAIAVAMECDGAAGFTTTTTTADATTTTTTAAATTTTTTT